MTNIIFGKLFSTKCKHLPNYGTKPNSVHLQKCDKVNIESIPKGPKLVYVDDVSQKVPKEFPLSSEMLVLVCKY